MAESTVPKMCEMVSIALSRFVPWIKCIVMWHYGHFRQIPRYGEIKYVPRTSEHIQLLVVKAT